MENIQTRTKKICFVSDYFIGDSKATITGPMVQTYLIGKELLQRGWEVHYLAYNRGNKTGSELYEGMTVHWIRQRKFFQFLNYFLFMDALKAVNANYYYQRGREVFTGFIARYCLRHSKRFVWASSGDSGVERGKYIKQLSKKKRSFLKKIVLWVEAIINDHLCEFGIEHASAVIVQTESQKTQLKKAFGLDSVVIQSGHEVPLEIRKSLPLKILWIGSIKPVKRPELFIELAKLCQDLNCEFWLAGQIVDSKLGEKILAMANDLKNFKFLGAIPFRESQKVISGAHVLVNTTDDGYEGLPNAFVQAWLAGTVTLSLHADPDGFIQNYRVGIKANTVLEMQTEINRLLAEKSRWFQMSENAKTFSREKFSINTITDRIEIRLTGEQKM